LRRHQKLRERSAQLSIPQAVDELRNVILAENVELQARLIPQAANEEPRLVIQVAHKLLWNLLSCEAAREPSSSCFGHGIRQTEGAQADGAGADVLNVLAGAIELR